jgi:hypothetical protein
MVLGSTPVIVPEGSSPRYPVMLGTPLQLLLAEIRPVLDQFCVNGPLDNTWGVVSARRPDAVMSKARRTRLFRFIEVVNFTSPINHLIMDVMRYRVNPPTLPFLSHNQM